MKESLLALIEIPLDLMSRAQLLEFKIILASYADAANSLIERTNFGEKNA